jgi:hypothetical protein
VIVVSTADAVDRATSGDGLPALLMAAGGPFGVVQSYWPRTPGKRTAGQLYVLRRRTRRKRFSNHRLMDTYTLVLRLVWPLTSGSGNAEADQRAFDAAIDLVLTRLSGFLGDHTHGGRFLSVAEDPGEVEVVFDDPAHTLPPDAEFRAEITYFADDRDFTG